MGREGPRGRRSGRPEAVARGRRRPREEHGGLEEVRRHRSKASGTIEVPSDRFVTVIRQPAATNRVSKAVPPGGNCRSAGADGAPVGRRDRDEQRRGAGRDVPPPEGENGLTLLDERRRFPAGQRGPERDGDSRAARPQRREIPDRSSTPATESQEARGCTTRSPSARSVITSGPETAAVRVIRTTAVAPGGTRVDPGSADASPSASRRALTRSAPAFVRTTSGRSHASGVATIQVRDGTARSTGPAAASSMVARSASGSFRISDAARRSAPTP